MSSREIILVGSGRTGSTLIGAMLSHCGVTTLGECTNLVCSTYRAFEQSWVPAFDEIRAEKIRELLRHPESPPIVMYKLLGVPTCHWQIPDFAEWYWRVLGDVFPGAKFFATTRDRTAQIESAMRKFGCSREAAAYSYVAMESLLLHANSPIDLTIRLEVLQQSPEQEMRRLSDYLNLQFSDSCLVEMNRRHSPASG